MEKVGYSELAKKIIMVVVLTAASMLAFVLYHLVISPQTTTYGVSDSVNVSVQVDPAVSSGPPTIISIGPLSGPEEGGTKLTVIGTYLNGVTKVGLGSGFECAPIVHVNDGELTCTMPPHYEGYVDVTLTSLSGTATEQNGFRYLAAAPKPPDSGGSGPLVPNTGLFRLGKHIITLYDVLILAAVVALWAVALWLIVWKRPRRHEDNADKKA